jgi:hypothetical protein
VWANQQAARVEAKGSPLVGEATASPDELSELTQDHPSQQQPSQQLQQQTREQQQLGSQIAQAKQRSPPVESPGDAADAKLQPCDPPQHSWPGASCSSGGDSSSKPFWRCAPVLATAYDANGKLLQGLSSEALLGIAQCELVTGFLPPQLALQVLLRLMQDQPSWQHMPWYFNTRSKEQTQQSPQKLEQQPVYSSKTSCVYELQVRLRAWVG